MYEQPEDGREADPKGQRAHRASGGLGAATGLVLTAWVCFWIPSYLFTSSSWALAWHLAGGVLGAFGAAGAFVELGRASRVDGFGTVAAAVVVATPAGVLHLLQSGGSVTGLISSTFRIMVVLVLFFSVTGVAVAVGKFLFRLSRAAHSASYARAAELATGLTLAFAGLAAAVFNFL